MTQTNIRRFIGNIRDTNIYTPLIEAIVNSMQAIDDRGGEQGKITIEIERGASLFDDDESASITTIIIRDNGIGFDEANLKSFDEIYSERKVKKGGKGFGRLTFLKYFENADIESIFEKDGEFFKRTFKFVPENDIISSPKLEKIEETDTALESGTVIKLNNLKKEHRHKIDQTADTIGRKLLEQLLVYFALEDYICPIIEVIDTHKSGRCILNGYIGVNKDIQQVKLVNDSFVLKKTIDQGKLLDDAQSSEVEELFKIKAFKIFYSHHKSSVSLVADNRLVTEQFLHSYVPEFKDDFVETDNEDKTKNYAIRAYVLGRYLDENIHPERAEFYFQKDENAYFSQPQIEERAVSELKETFKGDITTRQTKKRDRISKYVNEVAYWHKPYVNSLDFSKIPYDIKDEEIEAELQKIKFVKEQNALLGIEAFLHGGGEKNSENVQQLVDAITEASTSELVHYIASRRVIIDILEESLKWTQEDKKYELEKTVHDIIFPTHKSSEEVQENDHNLWILDERLNFHEYLYSDEPLNPKGKRPDIVIFNNKVTVRGGTELSNPIVVFEFKRPGRNDYKAEDDPIKQVGRYIEDIRAGKCKSYEGTKIVANNSTPAYGYIVCDITDKIDGFCKDHSFKQSPDTQGYFGYHSGYNVYFEVISFQKLLKDAKLRNSVFFKKLGIL